MHDQSVRLALGRCSYVRAFLGIQVRVILITACLSCKATKWGSPFGETAKTEGPCHNCAAFGGASIRERVPILNNRK